MRNARLDEAQAWLKISGRNINNLRYADNTTLMEESEEELKSLLMKFKEESEKAGLKLSTQKTKIVASCPSTSWQIDRETMETVTDFIFLGSKITADVDCSHEIKRHLLIESKVMTNLDSILKKQRHYFANKVMSSQSYDFSSSHVWIWELDHKECWALSKTLLGVPWTSRRSNQWILKKICPEYSLEGLMLNLNFNTMATWWEILTHYKGPWRWERLKAGEEDNREWDGWMASLTCWTWVWPSSESWWLTGKPGVLQSMGFQRVRHRWATELNWIYFEFIFYMVLENNLISLFYMLTVQFSNTTYWRGCLFSTVYSCLLCLN